MTHQIADTLYRYAAASQWRTTLEPLEDITAYELAIDRKYVNSSGIVSDHDLKKMGTALRHRVISGTNVRMHDVAAASEMLSEPTPGRSLAQEERLANLPNGGLQLPDRK